MKSVIFTSVLTLQLAVAAVATSSLQAAPDQPKPAAATTMRLKDFLWREVQDNSGRQLGGVSDVLAEMPSGKIVFVLIRSNQMYAEPKAVPPASLFVPADSKAPIRLDISRDRWINAPHLDWDPHLVVKDTNDGAKIYAYYQQRWLGTSPNTKNTGVNVVASRNPGSSNQQAPTGAAAPQFVSLAKMKLTAVTTPTWNQNGFVWGFVLDWPEHRVTHALISRVFPPVAPANEPWYAVPVALLHPPVERNALSVESSKEAFERAPLLTAKAKIPADNSQQIFRYPADVSSARVALTTPKQSAK